MGAILKVDLSKAYDNWQFIHVILNHMEFANLWIHLIMQCITTVSYSILINGEPSSSFSPHAGLRQGTPYPHTYHHCHGNSLQKLIKDGRKQRNSGIKDCQESSLYFPPIFSDDSLFYLKTTPQVCSNLKKCIDAFCRCSGEMVNLKRSFVIFSPNTPTKFKHFLRKSLQVTSKEEIGTYLGCPIDVDGKY